MYRLYIIRIYRLSLYNSSLNKSARKRRGVVALVGIHFQPLQGLWVYTGGMIRPFCSQIPLWSFSIIFHGSHLFQFVPVCFISTAPAPEDQVAFEIVERTVARALGGGSQITGSKQFP